MLELTKVDLGSTNKNQSVKRQKAPPPAGLPLSGNAWVNIGRGQAGRVVATTPWPWTIRRNCCPAMSAWSARRIGRPSRPDVTLSDLARTIRSKNAGTDKGRFDVILREGADYARLRRPAMHAGPRPRESGRLTGRRRCTRPARDPSRRPGALRISDNACR